MVPPKARFVNQGIQVYEPNFTMTKKYSRFQPQRISTMFESRNQGLLKST